ncbi:unnamed protein product [Urochloa humidicola]
MASDAWVKEYNEASRLADNIGSMIADRGSLPQSGSEIMRHTSAIRRKITILGTRLDSLYCFREYLARAEGQEYSEPRHGSFYCASTIYIVLAIVPAAMVAGLYFFDHSVASQMAQQKEFNFKNPSAYHYDIFVLSLTTLICGLLGVLPQSPMHTRSLAVLKMQLLRKKMVRTAKEGMMH